VQTIGSDTIEHIRRLFPALDRYAYFTTNGLGLVSTSVADALQRRIDDLARKGIVSTIFGNGALLDEARGRVARLLGAQTTEVAFCRNTSEGVLWSAAALPLRPGDEVLVAQGEYPANVLPWLAQEARGVRTRLMRQADRRVTPQLVVEAWSPRTRVLAVSFVQYNSGFRADLEALAETVHERGGILFCDGIQGLGALRLDVRETGVDLLAAGTHKWLLGLQGCGIFYCRRSVLETLLPVHIAAGSLVVDQDPSDPDAPYARELVHEARRFEEGTRNYLGIAALAESLRLIEEVGIDRIEARIKTLTDYLVQQVERRGCRVESPRGSGEWSGIVLFGPPERGPSASEIVTAMHAQHITINAREGCIHMGVHFYNTHEEIDRMLAVLDSQIGAIRPDAGRS
jgi:cysteine desulfurase/selenocysteine lyase